MRTPWVPKGPLEDSPKCSCSRCDHAFGTETTQEQASPTSKEESQANSADFRGLNNCQDYGLIFRIGL